MAKDKEKDQEKTVSILKEKTANTMDTAREEAKKTVSMGEFGKLSRKVNDLLRKVPGDSKLNAMLNTFRNEYGPIAQKAQKDGTTPNHVKAMEACKEAAIAQLSTKNRIGGMFARAVSGKTDIDKFDQIISNMKSGKDDLLEGVEVKPPKGSMREMFGEAKKAMSSISFSIPGRKKRGRSV